MPTSQHDDDGGTAPVRRGADVAPLRCHRASSSARAAAAADGGGDKMVVAITGATGFVGKKLVEVGRC